MEAKKKKRFGLIAAVVTLLLLIGAISWMSFAVTQNSKHQDTLARVESRGKIVWGVKSDTKLFGLMNTKTGEPEGFDIDMAKALTKQIGRQTGKNLTAEIKPIATASKIQQLKNTNIDGSIAVMTITPERAKIVDFTQPYFDAGQSLLVAKNSGITRIEDMNSPRYTVLVVVGTTAANEVKKFAPKAKVVALQDYASAMQALKAGQGQALSTDNAILYGLAKENPGYVITGPTFTHGPYGIAFDHNQPKMVKQTNEALDTLKKNGTYNRLIEKWFKGIPGLDWHQLEV
ncbi:transporter substrate-binding domain-containing protein [Eupransor demetentiae]|uniref:Periplasmic component/domain (HisJ) n=1 Tax=Eupransor demetentiae TaxID=3109584 RepID=A0ABP0ER80_9LACO|nr:ABC-type amino acid transport/signal transduction system [Lactobacillaceae bacterium LMG 33000]